MVFDAEFFEGEMRFAVFKGEAQFEIRKRLGRGAPLVLAPVEVLTGGIFRLMK